MERAGHYAYWWRRPILLAAAALAVGGVFAGSALFDIVKPFGFADPDAESARADDALEKASGERPLADVVLVVETPPSESPSASGRAGRELARIDGVTRVQAPESNPALRSSDGRAELVLGYVDAGVDSVADVGEQVTASFAEDPGILAGGAAVTAYQLNTTTEDDLRRIELWAAPLLFLLSLMVFRGLIAAVLPLVVGGISILATLLLLRSLSSAVDIDVYAINIVVGLGLGLAIDYCLFVVTRFRESLDAGIGTPQAVVAGIGATGRMIMFSGLTVAVALLGLCVFPQRFLYSLGIGGALVALCSALVCLTVLPALLATLGPRVNALSPGRTSTRASRRRWAGVARLVLRRPAPVAVAVAAVMIVTGLPFLRVELTQADARVLPAETSAHQVDVALQERFSADPAALVTIVLTEAAVANESQVRTASAELARRPGVGRVSEPRAVGDVARIDANLGGDPFANRALEVVEAAQAKDWGTDALVTGPPAALADQRESLGTHLPYALAAILGSTLILMFAMTRSLVLPWVAVAMNVLTVSVAFGVLVLVFQDGRFEGALDYSGQSALDTSMPILVFAVAFGLSTDYGVFLLQRISQARAAGESDAQAIATGLVRSGRIITAAALLFAVAMGALAFSDLVFVKEVAVGTAVAVLVDATLVRGLLLPAVLRLLGPAAWWSPLRGTRTG